MNISFISNLGQPAKLLSGGGQGREVWELYASGPKAYSQTTGDPVVGPGVGELMSAPCGAIMSQSGNYIVNFQPVSTNTLRPGWIARWSFSGIGGTTGVKVVQNAAGTGMTPGVYPITFSGGTGSGAAGTVTVSATAVTAINLTNPGSYTAAPTATIGGTPGGTPATLTVTLATAGAEVGTGANLSAENIQFAAVGGEF